MKKFLTVCAVAAFMLSLPSCKKCTTCTITIGGQSATGSEVCGNKSDVNAAEDACAASAASAGGTCSCS